jgi:hypothetical protein
MLGGQLPSAVVASYVAVDVTAAVIEVLSMSAVGCSPPHALVLRSEMAPRSSAWWMNNLSGAKTIVIGIQG